MKQGTFKFFSIIFIALLVAGFVAEALIMCTEILPTSQYVVLFLQDVASILAIYYLISGCNKSAGAKYFKAFMISFAVLILAAQIAYSNPFAILLMTVQFGALCLLAFGKDVGKPMSMTLTWIITACSVLQILVVLIAGAATGADWLKIGIFLVLSLGCALMVIAKYADKKSRGTK